MIFTCEQTEGVFDGRNLAQMAARDWPWITVVVALRGEARAGEFPARTVTLPKGWGEDELLNCAIQAERTYQAALAGEK